MNFLERLKIFLNNNLNQKKIIVIYGPTASWKTSLSIELAKNIKNSEIISVDSRQIYKYLDIWTWKIKEEEKQNIPHHMIDIITPDKDYSVGEFKNTAVKIINNLHNKWIIPILVGWTGLYLDSLIFDFDIPKVKQDKNLRLELLKDAEKYWKEYIYKKLLEIDKEYRLTIHPNNLNYVIRWIEVKLLSWKSKLDFRKKKKLKYDTLFLTPYDNDREKLYNIINRRIDKMFDEWLLDEFKQILDLWYKESDFWLKTIWYKELFLYINWVLSLDEVKELIKKNNRNYAKRQLTWFRKYDSFINFNY